MYYIARRPHLRTLETVDGGLMGCQGCIRKAGKGRIPVSMQILILAWHCIAQYMCSTWVLQYLMTVSMF